MGTFIYFAYGSNMLTERLVARCPSAQPIGIAYAQNYTLEFSKKSIDTSGKATLVPNPGRSQYGVLFEIDRSEQKELDKFEGASNGYDRIDSFAVFAPEDGKEIVATTYLATTPKDGLKPFDWYLALLVAGAKQHQLPPTQMTAFRLTTYTLDFDDTHKSRRDALEILNQIGIANPVDVLFKLETDY